MATNFSFRRMINYAKTQKKHFVYLGIYYFLSLLAIVYGHFFVSYNCDYFKIIGVLKAVILVGMTMVSFGMCFELSYKQKFIFQAMIPASSMEKFLVKIIFHLIIPMILALLTNTFRVPDNPDLNNYINDGNFTLISINISVLIIVFSPIFKGFSASIIGFIFGLISIIQPIKDAFGAYIDWQTKTNAYFVIIPLLIIIAYFTFRSMTISEASFKKAQ